METKPDYMKKSYDEPRNVRAANSSAAQNSEE